jgi:phenylacetate-CoA ligase
VTLQDLLQRNRDTQWLDTEELARLRQKMLVKCRSFHRNRNSWYRSHGGGVISRRDIQLAGDRFATDTRSSGFQASSSGSTGAPVTVTRSAGCNLYWTAYTCRMHEWHRSFTSWRMGAIRPGFGAVQVQDNWGHPMATLGPTGPSIAIPITTPIEEQVRLLRDFNPHIMHVFPSVLQGLLDRWIDQPALRPTSLKVLRTVSETVTPELRAAARAQGLAIQDIYSLSEAGYVALECPDGSLYHAMETIILEVLRDDGTPCLPGEAGRVVVSDLMNMASPLLRYETGDYAVRGGACRCGRGLDTLERVLGRRRNLVTLPDGRQRWPVVGHRQFRSIADIYQVQVIQHDLDDVEAIVVADQLSPSQEADLRALVHRSLDYPCTVRLTHRKEPILAPNGKFEEFISRVPIAVNPPPDNNPARS